MLPVMLSLYESVLERRSAIYCSSPVTSGRHYWQWVKKNKSIRDPDHAIADFREDHFKAVVLPNLEHSHRVTTRLRKLNIAPVIEPAAVIAIDGWQQQDWLVFWDAVIEKYAKTVVLIDGWEFSTGCVHELVLASRLGLPVFDEQGSYMEMKVAIKHIDAVLRDAEVTREFAAALLHARNELNLAESNGVKLPSLFLSDSRTP